jgi:hypothetical protein
MAEVVAIRTFMKLKVLEKIPLEDSISLQDLAKATGAQESLLGDYIPPAFLVKSYRGAERPFTERFARILGES